MAKEIERKFLLANDGWRSRVAHSVHLKDGLLLQEAGRKFRVRSYNGSATMCFKGPRNGLVRDELEYVIPISDAELLFDQCDGRILEKTRHYVPDGDLTWEIDCYQGLLSGVMIAEVELQSEAQDLHLPDWIGEEITADPAYTKVNMLAARLKREP